MDESVDDVALLKGEKIDLQSPESYTDPGSTPRAITLAFPLSFDVGA